MASRPGRNVHQPRRDPPRQAAAESGIATAAEQHRRALVARQGFRQAADTWFKAVMYAAEKVPETVWGDVLLIYDDGSALFVSADSRTVRASSLQQALVSIRVSKKDIRRLLHSPVHEVRVQVIAAISAAGSEHASPSQDVPE